MALSREDKADVKGALGKAMANKVAKVTKDKKLPDISRHPLHTQRQMVKDNPSISYKTGLKSK